MDEKSDKTKSVWSDISKVWGKIAGVIAAVGVSATFMVKVFNTSPELTYSLFAVLGIILLITSLYVDKQAEYTRQEMIRYEHKAREDFTRAINETRNIVQQNREDAERRIESFRNDVKFLVENAQETRRDTLRIQLLMILEQQPGNIDTILKLAEEYFVKLGGDWYMTSEFNKWAKAHEIMVPTSIYKAIDETHNKKQEENK